VGELALPTVGWILEADLDAFYERQPVIDLPPLPKPTFHCPFCGHGYYVARDLDQHVSVERM
jgi:hypothetical protein